jgi:hypothetical protein
MLFLKVSIIVKIRYNFVIGFTNMYDKNKCQKVINKLAKSWQKIDKKLVKILKWVGGGEEGDLQFLDQVRPCCTW